MLNRVGQTYEVEILCLDGWHYNRATAFRPGDSNRRADRLEVAEQEQRGLVERKFLIAFLFETNDDYFDYYRHYHALWKLYGIGLPDQVLKGVLQERVEDHLGFAADRVAALTSACV